MHRLLAKAGPLYDASNPDVLEMFKRVASAVGVAGSDDANVLAAASKVQKLTPSVPAPQVAADVSALVTAIEQLPVMTAPAAGKGGAANKPVPGSPAGDLAVIK